MASAPTRPRKVPPRAPPLARTPPRFAAPAPARPRPRRARPPRLRRPPRRRRHGQLLPGVVVVRGARAAAAAGPLRLVAPRGFACLGVADRGARARQAPGPHRPRAGPAHGGREGHLRRGQGARARAVRRHVAVHAQGHGAQVRVQDHQQEEAVHQGGRGGRAARGADHVPPVRPAGRGGAQGRVRGQGLRAPRHGALRRRRALRPHHRQGPLHRARRRLAAPHHRRDRAHLPLHGRHPPRPQARELPPPQQGRGRAAQGHRLWALRLLQGRGGVQGHRRQRLLHRSGGAEAELRARGRHMERRRHSLHPALRRSALLGRVGARHLQRHPEGAGRLHQRPMAAHLAGRQGPRQEDAQP
uniref:Uncharacterized protein n=1 Tax=Zea mays TaxID=4577 RepID=C4IYT1_MAIZE|nr:unknown [Zea mays]|eukprot:NP_001170570.1 uncharacterized protein LOC100384596 [Zea mays]